MKKTVLLITVVIILSACGTTPQVTPTALPPTASFTPSPTKTPLPTATLTPTSTPTPKIGTVYLDPKYDLNDRVKIIETNQEALWKYTTESFMMLNSYTKSGKRTGSYMQRLAESVGIEFKDKAALLEYLINNPIPTEIEGVEFMYSSRGSNEVYLEPKLLKKQEELIYLSLYPVQIISFEDYPAWYSVNQDVASQLVTVSSYEGQTGYEIEIMGGLLPVVKGDHIEFVYIVVNVSRSNKTSFLGFPEIDEPVTASQSEKLNAYIGALTYVMKIWSVGRKESPIGSIQWNRGNWGLARFPDDVGFVWISGTRSYFDTIRFNRSQLSDFPPDFIEPR